MVKVGRKWTREYESSPIQIIEIAKMLLSEYHDRFPASANLNTAYILKDSSIITLMPKIIEGLRKNVFIFQIGNPFRMHFQLLEHTYESLDLLSQFAINAVFDKEFDYLRSQFRSEELDKIASDIEVHLDGIIKRKPGSVKSFIEGFEKFFKSIYSTGFEIPDGREYLIFLDIPVFQDGKDNREVLEGLLKTLIDKMEKAWASSVLDEDFSER